MSDSTSHAALPYPIKGARFSLALAFRVSNGTPTDPTSPDTEFSSDGGATFGDCAEEITTGGSNGLGYLTLTGAETNNDMLLLAAKSSNCLTTPASLYPRGLASIGTGTLSAGSAGGGTLGTILAYDLTGCFIKTTGGTGGGGTGGANNQARKIATYDVTTGAFTVSPNWETTPDNTTTYAVLLPEGVTLGMLRALNPTTPGRTLDVSSGGEAGVDLANVGSPTTTLNLSGTTVKTATDVEADTQDIQNRLPAALTGDGNIKSDALKANGAAIPTNFASLAIDSTGRVNSFLIGILASVFTEGATGRIAAAFKQFFNIASPASTMDRIVLVDTATNTGTLAGAATVVLTDGSLTTNKLGAFALAKTTNITGFNDLSAAQVNTEADAALSDAGVTTSRTGYLDNLNVGGNVASSAEVTAIQNNTRVVRVVPDVIERPDSGTTTYRVEVMLYDSTGGMEVPDSAPTISLVNQSGTDRSSRLDSTTMALVSTGRYRAVYTADVNDTLEQLVWAFSVVEGAQTRIYGNTSVVVDTTAVDFTSADRTKLTAVFDKLPTNNIGDQTLLSASIATAQSDITTIKGYTDDIGVAGAGLTALGDTRLANLDATISSRTKPADTQAAVTTVTNLTNAATNGDLTATMKASVTAAVPTAAANAAATRDVSNASPAANSVGAAINTAVSQTTAAQIRADVGLTSANLDTQFGLLATAANLATLAAKFTGITLLAQWLGAAFGKQTPNSTALTEINATGAGSGTFTGTTDSLEAIRDRGDAAWVPDTDAIAAAIAEALEESGVPVDGASVAAIAVATANALASTKNLTLVQPNVNGTGVGPIVKGDSYYAADGRALLIPLPEPAPDLDGATVLLTIGQGIEIDGEIVEDDDGSWAQIEVTSEVSATLNLGKQPYNLVVTLADSHDWTAVQGTWNTIARMLP